MLGEAAGRRFVCGEACALWEPGGAVVTAGCLVDRLPLDLRRQPDEVQRLLELKHRLESRDPAPDGRADIQLAALIERSVHGAGRRR